MTDSSKSSPFCNAIYGVLQEHIERQTHQEKWKNALCLLSKRITAYYYNWSHPWRLKNTSFFVQELLWQHASSHFWKLFIGVMRTLLASVLFFTLSTCCLIFNFEECDARLRRWAAGRKFNIKGVLKSPSVLLKSGCGRPIFDWIGIRNSKRQALCVNDNYFRHFLNYLLLFFLLFQRKIG